ncbi:MAG: oligosaccharide flippase family protein [Gammaproteobacteria bacterium]
MTASATSPSRLRHSILRLLSGNVVFAIGQFAIVIALAKVAGVEAVGIYALANAITAPIYGFASLGLRPSLSTDARHSHTLSSYVRLLAHASGLALIGCIIGSLVLDANSTLFWCIVGLSVARIAENGSVLIYGLHQKHEQMSLIGRSLALRGAGGLCVVVICLLIAPERIEFAVLGLGAAWLSALLCHDILCARDAARVQRELELAPDTVTHDDELSLLRVVWPIGALALVTTLILNVPRYAVEYFAGTDSLGYFAAIMQFAVAGTVIVNSIVQAVVPRLSKLFISNRKAYLQLLFRALAVCFGIGLAGILVAVFLGEWILRLVYTEAFAQHADTLIVAMIYSLFLYLSVTLGSAMSAMRSFRSQFFIGCGTLTGTALGALFFVPKFGIIGGAMALITGVGVKILLQTGTIVALLRRA